MKNQEATFRCSILVSVKGETPSVMDAATVTTRADRPMRLRKKNKQLALLSPAMMTRAQSAANPEPKLQTRVRPHAKPGSRNPN
jgi:hypothetical protein